MSLCSTFNFVDEQMGISTSASASLFSGSLNEQITQATNFTTSVLPTSTSGLPDEERKQLTTGQTNGNHPHPGSAENVTQNNISSNTSQNMIKDIEETTTLGDHIAETENSEFVYENTTAGGLNDSLALPSHSDANFISAKGTNIFMNSTMKNEALTNQVTPISDNASLPSDSFQNITIQGASQIPDILNSTSSQFGINVIRSNVADDITNDTINEHINETLMLNSRTESFLSSSDNSTLFTAIRENTTGPSGVSPGQSFFATDDTSVSSFETEDETTASFSTQLDGLGTVTNESVDTVVEFTTESSWDASTGGTTDESSGGTIISDNQAASKSDAVTVAVAAVIGLLLIAVLIIAFMLIRRRIIYG